VLIYAFFLQEDGEAQNAKRKFSAQIGHEVFKIYKVKDFK
jgi:hypothetical protein